MSDDDNLILIAVGPDRIGLVEKISEFIVQHRCNIEDSRMAVFLGEFAIILLISGESKSLLEIANAYNDLSAQTGLNVWVKRPTSKKPAEACLPYQLVASCMDHPGVVYRLTTTLSNLGINIESMETKTYAAPVSGAPIFRMEATISVPGKLNIGTVRQKFDEIEKEENIDIEFNLITNGSSTS